MNLQLFEPHNDIHKHINKVLNNSPFFLNCKKCYNAPEVILKDNKYIIVSCPNCNIIKNENLDNLSNYTSKWITNEINNFWITVLKSLSQSSGISNLFFNIYFCLSS